MFSLEAGAGFERRLRRFRRRHPELELRLRRLLQDLQEDPFQPRLRLHALGGELTGVNAVWLNYQYRVTLTLDTEAEVIILLDIGSHDEVYG